jgi:hypothetical protein
MACIELTMASKSGWRQLVLDRVRFRMRPGRSMLKAMNGSLRPTAIVFATPKTMIVSREVGPCPAFDITEQEP